MGWWVGGPWAFPYVHVNKLNQGFPSLFFLLFLFSLLCVHSYSLKINEVKSMKFINFHHISINTVTRQRDSL